MHERCAFLRVALMSSDLLTGTKGKHQLHSMCLYSDLNKLSCGPVKISVNKKLHKGRICCRTVASDYFVQ